MSAAEKLPDLAEVRDAMTHEDSVRRGIELLEEITKGEVRLALGRPAGHHREEMDAATDVLCWLSEVGATYMLSAQAFPEHARKLEAILPQAQWRIRVLRAAHALILGEKPDDAPEIREEATEEILKRGQEAFKRLTPEEQADLADNTMADPAELISWLDAP